MMKSPYSTHDSMIVYQTPWINIHEDKVTLPNGEPGTYSYMESKDSVMIAALDDEDRVYLVKGFCYPSKTWGWELPGGGGEGEELIEASKRELREETGIIAKSWRLLGKTLVCDGLMTEWMATCVAYDIKIDERLMTDEESFSDKGFFTFDQIDQMVTNGEINDGQTMTGLYLLEKWVSKRNPQKNTD